MRKGRGSAIIPAVSTTQDSLPVGGKPGQARVVIVGCGFGGLFCARALKSAPVALTVIDRNNYHLFQPLLYQVASAALAPADIAQPIRTILRGQKNALVMLGEVERVDLDAEVHFRQRHGRSLRLPHSRARRRRQLLRPRATGRAFAPGMKEVEDATLIRSRLLMSFEAAEFETER